ncbi:hypothetical protein SGCOL_001981 [Colletotrichum sp. CLE4]
MAQDLALQRDLKGWVRHDSSIATPEDVEIRRRIYWDCYISDKLFSLIIGQPVHLVYDDAEVQPMETLPVRIALNYDQAIASRGCDADEKPQSYCVTSAQHITSLVHTYRSHYGLQHATLVFVYGAVQGSHSAKTFSITEESQYLIQMLGELSSAWSLSREVMAKVLDC